MNSIRTWACLLAASALTLFGASALAAKPQQAPDKSFGVEFLLPDTAPDGTPNPSYDPATGDPQILKFPVTVTVYIKNESPPSTAASNASSLRFTLSGLVVVGVSCPRANCGVSGDTISVSNISPPIQAKEEYPVTLQVNSCVVSGEALLLGDPQVFTGSQFSGSQFTLVSNDPTFPTRKVLSQRNPFPYDFDNAPTSVANTGIRCGSVACGLQQTVPNLFGDATATMTIWRGPNADATCSSTNSSDFIDYFVTNDLWSSDPDDPHARKLHASWSADTVSPVFAYKLTRATAPPPAWEVGWAPKPGDAVTFTAPQCFGGLLSQEPMTIANLPFPKALGVLAQDVKTSANKIKVDTGTNGLPTIPPGTDGLPIRIDGEWMLVTAVGSTSWDVTRVQRQFHSAGATVATTPMPLLTSIPTNYPAPPTPAQMCMVWISTDGKTAAFMDGSDGWILGR